MKLDKLTPMQKHVTKEIGTEPPYQNEYWDNTEEGIYVDIISGEPLFSSNDQYDAACDLNSKRKTTKDEEVLEKEVNILGMRRVEVSSKTVEAHLGHVFPDGANEAGGDRYCINTAALKFIKKEDLEKEGYGEFLKTL